MGGSRGKTVPALKNFRLAQPPITPTFPALKFYLTFMAKTCWIEREKKKAACVAKYAALRAELKKKGDYLGLQALPKNASPARLSRRCNATGRKRAYIGRFQLSRITLRELASNGLMPGVTKSSW